MDVGAGKSISAQDTMRLVGFTFGSAFNVGRTLPIFIYFKGNWGQS